MKQWPSTEWQTSPKLVSRSGGPVPLQAVEIAVEIQHLLAEMVITQDYTNHEAADIEVSYTFPVPTEAVLLGVQAKIGDREIAGQVAESADAESHYEDAIADGDSAILLQRVRPGLYSLSLGNLQSGEEARITYRYGLALCWNGDRVDLRLPTAIAPKYGSSAALGLPPHQTVDADPTYRCQYELTVSVAGLLADAVVSSPSHDIATHMEAGGLQIGLQDSAADMDRDLVLNFRLRSDQRCSATMSRDGEGFVAMLSYRPSIPNQETSSPRNLALVVDCSGSMNGDSIRQAGAALSNIAERLSPQDRINVILFGSHHRALFPGQVLVEKSVKNRIRRLGRSLQADMGGTELASALRVAYDSLAEVGPGEVLLITDGSVCAEETILGEARSVPHRVFTVGVGSAVSEGLLKALSAATGGSAEFVTPNEDMAERITRHFERIRSGRAGEVNVQWPQSPRESLPLTRAIFDGDTVHLYYWFDSEPVGSAQVELKGTAGVLEVVETEICSKVSNTKDSATVTPLETLARFAAARKLDITESREEALAIALEYQLLSPWTSFVAVDQRVAAGKAGSMPELRKVPQMQAAGWGGLSSLSDSVDYGLDYMDLSKYRVSESLTRSLEQTCANLRARLDLIASERPPTPLPHTDHIYRARSNPKNLTGKKLPPGLGDEHSFYKRDMLSRLPIEGFVTRLAQVSKKQDLIIILKDFKLALNLYVSSASFHFLFTKIRDAESEEKMLLTLLLDIIQLGPETLESKKAVNTLLEHLKGAVTPLSVRRAEVILERIGSNRKGS
ncbi:hypothetical protein AWR36_006085 [Microbulbifer flavimaris]|uniref:Ca-activated chloride channel family protein n=1 Tax=Microbulbifer flavimaris TaxID=1781068 RepID=A0ABX4I1B3_9GAMM|nr:MULTISPECIES: VIT and VWA domain-containing protein [Microbulbifer]KUJ83427.1 hypothetical protein AVO43_06070 [Microbulbifer sp. ZGT114]PCO05583.1 hypothetical protein AWR36_006085 [Microbulbifer flavimaris]